MPPAFFLSRFALALLFAPLAAGAQLRVQDASVLAGTCLNCHGPEGRSAGAIPSLRGHTAGYLLQRLQAFRTGQAPDATVMTRLMKGYDDAQVEALAHRGRVGDHLGQRGPGRGGVAATTAAAC